jgi:hypothetical protein
MMRLGLAALSRRERYRKADLEACMRAVEMDEKLVEALRVLGAQSRSIDRSSAIGSESRVDVSEQDGRHREANTSEDSRSPEAPRVEMVIASDANNVFIETILDANELPSPSIFQKIYTNRASWVATPNLTEEDEEILRSFDLESQQPEDQPSPAISGPSTTKGTAYPANEPTLDVQPYQSPSNPHNCTRCAPNMCKSTILIQSKLDLGLTGTSSQQLRTVYVGDGFNDYCPALSLDSGDLLLVREGYALEKLLKREQEEDQEAATEQDTVVNDAEVTEEGAKQEGVELVTEGERKERDSKVAKPRVQAEIRYWKTQADLAVLLLELVGADDTARRSELDGQRDEKAVTKPTTVEAEGTTDLIHDFSKKAVL